MKPVLAVLVATALVFGPGAQPVAARPAEGSVTYLSVIPSSGKAEVVIGVAGGLEVRDFTLRSPDRIVLDLSGASLGLASRSYDRVSRGGIMDVKYSQFRKGTVRVVVYLDGPRAYQVSKADGEVRVAVTTAAGAQFAAWHIGGGTTPEARSRNRNALNARVAEILSHQSTDYWDKLLYKAGVPCGPINTIDKVFADPQVQHLGIAKPIDHPKYGPQKVVGQPIHLSRYPQPDKLQHTPESGEHTVEVLSSLGYDTAAIAALRAKGVV